MARGNKNVMIGCPEDAECYIGAIKRGIESFNVNYGKQYRCQLQAKHWKPDTYSTAENPQEAINRQLCDDCDLLIAVFYQSAGSAIASEKPGTFQEIDYFHSKGKNAFVFEFKGKAPVDMNDVGQISNLVGLVEALKENRKNIYFAEYKNENELIEKIEKNLRLYFESKKAKRKKTPVQKKNHMKVEAIAKNELQIQMEYHMRQCDTWNWMSKQFSFYNKSRNLIDGMKEDGSVQYYVGRKERYRTTPVASVLEALYLGGLIPASVCWKMQDWVYLSREDPCDEPDKSKSGEHGHKPETCDQYGWSWNEGVSVWATSKALNTLIETGYYRREDVCSNPEICKVTCNALSWIADQAYDNGGWGFQKAEHLGDCAASVTMTALTLTAITRFLIASEDRKGIALEDDLENRLSEAKQKGIQYLLNTKKEDNDRVYWEYNGKPSLTGTIWVLDFINIGQKSETGALYYLRNRISNFCLDRIPGTEEELDRYQEEVYFTGGITKYKSIPKNSKFYSYMPYHIVTLLNAGIDPDNERILTCMRGLITGKDDYWKGTDRSVGAHQRPSCFVIAMALGVIAVWMKNKIRKTILVENKK